MIPAGALVVALACGVGFAGYAGYDSTFALIWGRELAGGDAPAFDGPFAPAPHPLLNVIGALLSPLGAEAAAAVLELLSLAGLVLLAVAAHRLGAALFSWAAGAVAAALLVTRPEIVELALFAQFDVPFLALVLLAAAREAEGRRGVAPLALLAVAGLLRPEAWLMAGAYALYLRRPKLLALAAVAPLLWVLHDLVLTGDPLFTLHTTGEFADRHRTGVGIADAPDLILDVTGVAVALCGVAGWLLVPPALQRRIALPAALFGIAVVPFVVYGALGFELYARFLLPAAAALAVLAAAAATFGSPRRGVALATAVVLAATLPFTVADLADVREKSSERARLEASLLDLMQDRRADVDACGLVLAPSFRLVPPLMHRLDLPGERFTDRPTEAVNVLRILVAPDRDHVVEQLEPDPVRPSERTAPPGTRVVARNDEWSLAAGC